MAEMRREPCAACGREVVRYKRCTQHIKRFFCNRECCTTWRRANASTVTAQLNTSVARSKARETFKTTTSDPNWVSPILGRKHSSESIAKMSKRQSERVLRGEWKPYGHNKHGHYTSTKTGVEMYYRSSWELAFMKWLDANENVKTYSYESFRIAYKHNDQKRWYVPDFLVEWNGSVKYLYELKPKEFLNDERTRAKCMAATGYAHNNGPGLYFHVLTREELVEWGVL